MKSINSTMTTGTGVWHGRGRDLCRRRTNVSLSFQKLGRDPSDEDCFFDLLSKFQSSRMDDQRCHLDEPQNGDNGEGAANSVASLNDMIGPLVSGLDPQKLLKSRCEMSEIYWFPLSYSQILRLLLHPRLRSCLIWSRALRAAVSTTSG